MDNITYIPSSLRSAGHHVRQAVGSAIERLPTSEFVRAWSSLAYLFPGMHPDGFWDDDNEWPQGLRRFGAEAWRRAQAGELSDEELYPSDAQWAGICDRMTRLTPAESARRQELAAAYGDHDA